MDALADSDPIASHRLDKLLKTQSIALLGASDRQDSNGLALVQMSKIDGYRGRVYPVNPNYAEIDGLPRYPSLAHLPETVDLVAIAVGNQHLEEAVDHAIAHGTKGIVMFGSAHLETDVVPALSARIQQKAASAGIAICGPNSMGFYTPPIGLRIAGFPSPAGLRAGGVAYIAQSGSAFSALVHNERRLGFVVCVSSGSELGCTAADYLDWSLRQPETRVVGLFIEEVRHPHQFRRALELASSRDVPVVILKVGRTARSAEMALSHTGALAGNDQAFVALCKRHGVIIVEDLDEMAATLQFFDQQHKVSSGDLATMHDSGGERELLVDTAERLGVRFAEIEASTRERILPMLDSGHLAENPLDAWGTPRQFVDRYESALQALASDPHVSAAIFFSDIRDDYWYSQGVVEAVQRVAKNCNKPIAIATNFSKTTNSKTALELAKAGVPVLEGTREALLAYQHALAWRDRPTVHGALANPIPTGKIAFWRDQLTKARSLSEDESLSLLADFGLATIDRRLAATAADACAAAEEVGYPVALKTAEGHAHKSEMTGVYLGLATPGAVLAAYQDLSHRLGPKVLISRMARPGVEIGLGAVVDPAFGPLIVLSAGGTLIEYLQDTATALAPISTKEGIDLLKDLKTFRLLEGVRGKPPANIEALAELISRFSMMVATLSDVIAEIDVNPVVASDQAAIAVDALVISKLD